ncbi:MAG: DUF11 domain-containing protein, partial [Verrucomicrobiota bacterium]
MYRINLIAISLTLTLSTGFGQVDLSLTKTVSDPHPFGGDEIFFRLTVSNAGPAQATGVMVSDPLTETFTWLSAGNSQGHYNPTTG